MCTFFTRKLGYVHDGQSTVILRVSAIKKCMLRYQHDRRQPTMILQVQLRRKKKAK